ncbi:glycosyltransferase family A protein [Myroides ceti]|uniref:Glycosyltransferase family A protein n=1 Tax=Paenimyroides ceti TaxID=395087 RepID=A0ABT8D1A1_9FLAO|nr:glycosyltransferase family A protein [Paenimyroides ceti]MDN3710141.1 glycosyltransferase family A protein [Paenimyroides ceti]
MPTKLKHIKHAANITLYLYWYRYCSIILLLRYFQRICIFPTAENNPKRIPVSVILYAKNNAEEVRKIMPLLLNQNYHEFELVLVNNASFDETLDIFKEYASMYPNIRIVDVENNQAFWGSKKYALTLGIKASKHEYLLFIDAENRPSSETWLMQMSSHLRLIKPLY